MHASFTHHFVPENNLFQPSIRAVAIADCLDSQTILNRAPIHSQRLNFSRNLKHKRHTNNMPDLVRFQQRIAVI